MTTHPELVRALIRAVRGAGGTPLVGDSPGGPSTAGFVSPSTGRRGMTRVCDEEGVELLRLRPPSACGSRSPQGEPVQLVHARHARRSTATCSSRVPKFKTHGFMMFTGAVKNLFGCIPGLEKATYHLRVPDRDDFGSMLVDLCSRASRACRHGRRRRHGGRGPSGRQPRETSARCIASADCVALDVVASAMAGLDPHGGLHQPGGRATRARASLGRRGRVRRRRVARLRPDWVRAARADISAKMPSWLAPRMRSWVTPRPFLEQPPGCTQCRKCEQSCPVDAIEVGPSGTGVRLRAPASAATAVRSSAPSRSSDCASRPWRGCSPARPAASDPRDSARCLGTRRERCTQLAGRSAP